MSALRVAANFMRRGQRMAFVGVSALVCACALGCRGRVSKKPPVRLIRDMTQQAHLLPQYDPRLVNPPNPAGRWLAGTVAQEEPLELGAFETGQTEKGFVARAPITVDQPVLARGKERFNIYCSGCHDEAGTGQGIIAQRGFPGPIDFTSSNTRNLSDGEIFSIITRGVRNMPAWGDSIPVLDRWHIVVWVRVIQRSQHARLAEIQPPISESEILPEEVNP